MFGAEAKTFNQPLLVLISNLRLRETVGNNSPLNFKAFPLKPNDQFTDLQET